MEGKFCFTRIVVVAVTITTLFGFDISSAAETKSSTTTPKSSSVKTADKKHVKKTTRKASGGITESRALSIVSARPEVKSYLLEIKKSKMKGVTSQVELDRKENGEFIIHVYEYVPDDAETGHTATFNWYHVNAKSGKVSTEF